ncbi:MAG: ATPase domain-containing protein, partial [Bacteriovoracaceae bacterium]
HSFKITKEGVKFFPRIEVLYKTPLREPTDLSCKLKFGVNELDSMLKGGLTKGSMTTLIGAPGVGKTSLGAKFLVEGCKLGEHGLYVGFNESISR